MTATMTVRARIALADCHKVLISEWADVERVGFLSAFNHTFEALDEQVAVYYVVCDDGSYHKFPHPVLLTPGDKFRVTAGQHRID